MYENGEYDIAGYTTGVVEKSKLIDGTKVKEGDVLIGISSSGVHSNGYSLVRKICFDLKGFKGDEYIEELGKTIGEELLTPTRLYPKACLPLIENFDIHGMVHITGGGFYENIPRMLPEGIKALVKKDSYKVPVLFDMIQKEGGIDPRVMYNTYNMGIGMMLAVSPEDADAAVRALEGAGEKAWAAGETAAGERCAELC